MINPIKIKSYRKMEKERVKERWTEHFENVPNRDRVTEKDVAKNEKI